MTSIDPVNNWLFGLALDRASLPAVDTTIAHTYATPGNYLARIDSCCRVQASQSPNAHINNPELAYRVETTVTVGTGNSSPITALPPIVPARLRSRRLSGPSRSGGGGRRPWVGSNERASPRRGGRHDAHAPRRPGSDRHERTAEHHRRRLRLRRRHRLRPKLRAARAATWAPFAGGVALPLLLGVVVPH